MSDRSSEPLEVRVHRDDAEELPRLSELSPGAVEALAVRVFESEEITSGEVDIVFCGDRRITDLNLEWFDREGPTDCIAFDLREEGEPVRVEGEIYIDFSQADRQAPEFDTSLDEELRRLIVHGILHLLGYTDTGTRAEADLMRERQESLVASWNTPVLGETA